MVRPVSVDRLDVSSLLFLGAPGMLRPEPPDSGEAQPFFRAVGQLHDLHRFRKQRGVGNLRDGDQRDLRRAAGEVEVAIESGRERSAHRPVHGESRVDGDAVLEYLEERLVDLHLDLFGGETGIDRQIEERALPAHEGAAAQSAREDEKDGARVFHDHSSMSCRIEFTSWGDSPGGRVAGRPMRHHRPFGLIPTSAVYVQLRTHARKHPMRSHWSRVVLAGLLPAFLLGPPAAGAQRLDPIVYTLKFPAPDTHVADVVATIPTGKAATIELMIPVWSPGYYVQEDYVRRLHQFVARGPTGDSLRVEQPQPNRWRVTTRGAATITLTYELECSRPTVTGNSVVADYAVINGAPTFVTLVETAKRTHEVHIELPARWHQTATSLAAAGSGRPNDYMATSYDELVDSPIIIGDIRMHEFVVDGAVHYLADIGDIGTVYNGDSAATKLEKIARANARFWGGLPFKKYV